jgi:hypothetical protein
MATERDFELLDDYLTNRLDAGERSAFEQKIESDPDLKNEYKLQQRLIDGIQKARMAELKGMLNGIPVPPAGTGVTAIGKLAIGTFVVGAVATGIYFYMNQAEETKPVTEIQNTVAVPEQQTSPQDSNEITSTESKSAPDTNQVTDKKSEGKAQPSVDTQQDTEVVAEKRPLDVYDPNKETEGDKPLENANETSVKEAKPAGPSIAVDIDRNNKKFTFHYQLNGDRLILYGPFEKNLYEILEFFSDDDKRTAFLYYKEGYYQLKEDGTDKVKPLSPITDQNLIKKLKEYRNN